MQIGGTGMDTVAHNIKKPEKVRFKKYQKEDFFPVLKQRVEAHFKKHSIPYHGTTSLHLKALLLAVIYLTLYSAILSNNFQLIGLVTLYGLLGVTKGLIGFNLVHDALHGSFSSSRILNSLIGYWFDFNGTSSYVWKVSHNVQHHTYTNIPGHDQDIDKAIILRLNPSDKVYWFHRFQNWYAPFLYSLICINWVFYSDYAWFLGEAKKKAVPRKEIYLFLTLKALNLFFFLILPILYLSVPWWYVALGFLTLHICAGMEIAIVFQLAHIVDNVEYFEPDAEGNMEYNWAVHEMLTTSNFGTNNRILTEFIGGLNFQVEHHLFPNISHCHYPELQKVVKATAEEFGIPYKEMPSFSSAIVSHFRTLKRLGTETLRRKTQTNH